MKKLLLFGALLLACACTKEEIVFSREGRESADIPQDTTEISFTVVVPDYDKEPSEEEIANDDRVIYVR